ADRVPQPHRYSCSSATDDPRLGGPAEKGGCRFALEFGSQKLSQAGRKPSTASPLRASLRHPRKTSQDTLSGMASEISRQVCSLEVGAEPRPAPRGSPH